MQGPLLLLLLQVVACAPATGLRYPEVTSATTPTGVTTTDPTGFAPLEGDCGGSATLEDPLTLSASTLIESPMFELVAAAHAASRNEVLMVGQGGLAVFSADSLSPRLIWPDSGQERFHAVAWLGDDVVALGHRERGPRFVDIGGSSATEVPAFLDVAGSGTLLAADGLLLTASPGLPVTVWDVSDPRDPRELGSTPTALEAPWSAAWLDGWAYVADNAVGLVPVDLRDPANPTLDTPVATAGSALGVATDGRHLYVAAGAAGIEVFDPSTASSPLSLGHLPWGNSVVGVAAADGLAWGVTVEDVVLADAADPANLVPLAMEPTPEWALGVAAAGSSAWVADWRYGHRLDADPASLAPAADLEADTVSFYDGSGTTEVRLHNRGGAVLRVQGGESADPRVVVEIDRTQIETGDAATLRLAFSDDGAPLDTTVCVGTNDPSRPTLELVVQETSDDGAAQAVGELAADFELQDLEGRSWRLSDHRGVPVVLVYFATW